MRTSRMIISSVFISLTLSLSACDGGDEMENGMGDGAETDPASGTTGMPSMGPASTSTTDATTTTGEPADESTTSGGMESTSESGGESTGDTTGAAGSSSTGETVETAGNSDRFEDVVTESGMQALLDLETDLLWVNDVNACNPLGAPNEDTPMIAMQYCNDLVFQGHEDWRMPSTEEAAELITVALEEGVDLVYQNPGCPAVITMGGVAVETHNGDNPGDVTKMPPSLGVRCVRES